MLKKKFVPVIERTNRQLLLFYYDKKTKKISNRMFKKTAKFATLNLWEKDTDATPVDGPTVLKMIL